MRTPGQPTRLELHRLKFNAARGRMQLLQLSDLSAAEKEIINREILQDVRVKRIDFTGDMDEQIFDGVQSRVLSEFGVMCNHPISSLQPAYHSGARNCSVCGCLVAPWGAVPPPNVRTKTR